MVADHGNGDFVLDASGDDEIRDLALWSHVFIVVRLDEHEPLLYAAFNVTRALFDIPNETAREAEIGICFCKNLEV